MAGAGVSEERAHFGQRRWMKLLGKLADRGAMWWGVMVIMQRDWRMAEGKVGDSSAALGARVSEEMISDGQVPSGH